MKVKLVESKGTLLGYKVVAYDDGKFYSLQHPDMEYKATVGSTEMNPKGIYLGTSEEFVKDYYTELTDMQDALLTYEYLPKDLLRGNPESEGEVLVLKAKLKNIEVLDEIDESMFREPPRHKLIKHKKEYWNPFVGSEELEEGVELPKKLKMLAQGFIVASQLAGLGQTMASPQTTSNLPTTSLQRSQREMPSRDDEKIEEVAKRLMSALRKTKEKRGSGSIGDDQIKRMLRDLQKVLQSRDPRVAKQFFQQWKKLLAQLGIQSQSPQVLKSRFGLEEKTPNNP